MQIGVINAEDPNAFDYLCFPDSNPVNIDYIRNQLNTFSNCLTDTGRQFIEQSKAIYSKIADSNSLRMAKAAIRGAANMFHPNTIIGLQTLDGIRNAQPVMQRYIMAEPTIRKIYSEQRCDGYSDSYVDYHPNRIKDTHYDYRRVMDGVVEFTEEGWKCSNYYEELLEGDKELCISEQVNVLKTWDIVQAFTQHLIDPTDINEGKIGG